jgi:HK97 family phage major capsid protein
VSAFGATKQNVNVSLANYTATLYTLARIYDVGNQLLRHSAGAAEQLVRSQLARGIARGEAYYIVNGSGSSEPKGLLTSLAAAPAGHTTAHTASDSTVAGSVRAAVGKAVQALAGRDQEPSAIVMNSGDFAHAFVQGADAAGYYVDDTGRTTLLGLPIVTTTAIASQTAIVGDFKAADLFIGDDYRVDVSSEANDRWDKNMTGFRAEEEIAFNADPPVMVGAFQRITGLIP